jgi:predicted nucleotidyltransferase
MASHAKMLVEHSLITDAPTFISDGLCYEVIMGSFAYGASSDTSDIDIYGFCLPPHSVLFPGEYGWIAGFEKIPFNFEQYQKHDINYEIAPHHHKKYDVTIYNIAKYFRLCANGNPNMIDSLFVPERCITFSNEIGNLVHENRHLFLSKKCWHTFKGYAYSQLRKMTTKKPKGKRIATIEKYGYDVKFAYNLVRLLNEVEQILIEEDLDLERNREQLKMIRRGEWSCQEVIEYFKMKERALEEVYLKSKLPHKVRMDEIRNLLHACIQ